MVFPHLSCGCSTRVFLVSFVFRTLAALHTLPGCSTRSTEHANTSQDIFYATRFTRRRCRNIRSHHLTLWPTLLLLATYRASRKKITTAHPHGVNMPTCLESALSKKTRTPTQLQLLKNFEYLVNEFGFFFVLTASNFRFVTARTLTPF
jgi:hypothetical protein